MQPDPPRLRGLTAPCLYSRFLFSNQLPSSNFIETPGFELPKVLCVDWNGTFFPPSLRPILLYMLGHISGQDLFNKMLKDNEVAILSAGSCCYEQLSES